MTNFYYLWFGIVKILFVRKHKLPPGTVFVLHKLLTWGRLCPTDE